MKLNAEDLSDASDALTALDTLKQESDVIVRTAEVELRSGLIATVAYDQKADEFHLTEVENA